MATSGEFVASMLGGGAAGTMVDVVLYPLDTIKTRLQSEAGFLRSGGFKGVYRGLSSAAAGSAPCGAVFFATYEVSKSFLERRLAPDLAPIAHSASAVVAEMTTGVVRIPFEIVKQQLQANMHPSPTACVRHILHTSGMRGLFKGYFSLVAREVPFSLIQFPMYEYFKKIASAHLNCDVPALPGPYVAACGMVAGGVSAAITTPLDVVKTRTLLDQNGRGMGGLLVDVYRKEGAGALFAGVVPRVMWISIGGAIFFGAYEEAKRMVRVTFGIPPPSTSDVV